jgi:hypothetical protein
MMATNPVPPVDRDLALHAFRKGFHHGADPTGARKRSVLDQHTHQHWKAGLDAGRKAAFEAAEAYKRSL